MYALFSYGQRDIVSVSIRHQQRLAVRLRSKPSTSARRGDRDVRFSRERPGELVRDRPGLRGQSGQRSFGHLLPIDIDHIIDAGENVLRADSDVDGRLAEGNEHDGYKDQGDHEHTGRDAQVSVPSVMLFLGLLVVRNDVLHLAISKRLTAHLAVPVQTALDRPALRTYPWHRPHRER